jgi:hypothetical protein
VSIARAHRVETGIVDQRIEVSAVFGHAGRKLRA